MTEETRCPTVARHDRGHAGHDSTEDSQQTMQMSLDMTDVWDFLASLFFIILNTSGSHRRKSPLYRFGAILMYSGTENTSKHTFYDTAVQVFS